MNKAAFGTMVGFGGVLIGVGVLHLALGNNDPLSPLWQAVQGSLEVSLILLGITMIAFAMFRTGHFEARAHR